MARLGRLEKNGQIIALLFYGRSGAELVGEVGMGG